MSDINVLEKLTELVGSYLAQEGHEHLFLVEIKANKNKTIDVFVDSDAGLLLDEAAKMSRFLESHLDENLWFGDDYTLEVSSPGVGNPLKLKRQYHKNIGREVSVELLDSIKNAKGILQAVEEEAIVLTYTERITIEGTKKKKNVELEQRVPFANIKKTVVKISFN
jgi:ribosome maturation factor RimP